MPNNVIIGVNILEILTTGMYRDSRVIFREYIQNSCDQINLAVKKGILASEDEGEVKLWIDDKKRSVSIEDNATGITAAEFERTLYSIGESSKTLGEEIGFRGIGHWCGLGYCKTLIFKSKAYGEKIESVMLCDAEQMRRMMDDHNTHRASYSVDDVLAASVKFSQNTAKDKNAHYFKVEMFDIPALYAELYTLMEIKNYLSFVAPIEYDIPWRFKTQIHLHANRIGQPIPEYNVSVNEEPVRKKYMPSFTTSKGEDTITDVDFQDFKDGDGNIIAWLWFGISRFQGVLKQDSQMRGIRLRMQNIQIGSDDALQKLFKEDRGQHYFIGEVFAITRELIPNAQRDYFNPGEARLQFEHLLSEFFNDELSRIYKAGSNINSKYDKIQKMDKIETEIASALVVTEEQRQKLDKAKHDAETAVQELTKIRQKTSDSLSNGEFGIYEVVIDHIIKHNDEERTSALSPAKKTVITEPTVSKQKLETERKTKDTLVSLNKIRAIIRELADFSIAEAIIAKIEKEIC
jgi:molecular chaperone HtpG